MHNADVKPTSERMYAYRQLLEKLLLKKKKNLIGFEDHCTTLFDYYELDVLFLAVRFFSIRNWIHLNLFFFQILFVLR